MKTKIIITAVALLTTLALSAQTVQVQKIKTVKLRKPVQNVGNFNSISVDLHLGDVSDAETLSTLENLGPISRKELWASEQFSDKLEELYFQFPGYSMSGEGLEVDLFFDKLNIVAKNLIEDRREYGEGDDLEVRIIHRYDLFFNFPCSLKVAFKGQTILTKDIFPADFHMNVWFGAALTEEFLEADYRKNQSVAYRMIERDALISALMKAKKIIETNFLYSYIPMEVVIASANHKKHDYSELNFAGRIINDAFNEYGRDLNKAKLIESLVHVRDIWEEEAAFIDTEKKKARIGRELGTLIYNNLAVSELVSENFDAAEAWINKGKALELYNPHLNATAALIQQQRKESAKNLKQAIITLNAIPLEQAVGYKELPKINWVDKYIFKYRRIQQVFGYDNLVMDE